MKTLHKSYRPQWNWVENMFRQIAFYISAVEFKCSPLRLVPNVIHQYGLVCALWLTRCVLHVKSVCMFPVERQASVAAYAEYSAIKMMSVLQNMDSHAIGCNACRRMNCTKHMVIKRMRVCDSVPATANSISVIDSLSRCFAPTAKHFPFPSTEVNLCSKSSHLYIAIHCQTNVKQ